MIGLKIDNRECRLIELLNLDFLQISYENLQYADIVFEVDGVPILYIERKTLDDLSASVKDGRFFNQKSAMLQNIDRNMIYYLIEGQIDYTETDIQNKIIVSCVLNTMIRDDIKVLYSKDMLQTTNIIIRIAERLYKHPEKYVNVSRTHYEKIITKFRASELSKDKFFENVITQIPGVSTKSAKAIAAKFGSLRGLHDALNGKTEHEKLGILSNIVTEDSHGKRRKISSKIVKNIVEYFT